MERDSNLAERPDRGGAAASYVWQLRVGGTPKTVWVGETGTRTDSDGNTRLFRRTAGTRVFGTITSVLLVSRSLHLLDGLIKLFGGDEGLALQV